MDNRHNKKLIMYFMFSVFYFLMLESAEAVNCSTTLEANTVYILTEDLYINGSTCFNINVENVTIDCDGFSITGNNAGSTYGVYSNQFNTTIRSCQISNFTTGIYFNGAENGMIQNTNVTITKFWDMYTHEGTGIALVNTNNTLITNCNGNAIESTVGIYLRSSSYNTISNSTGASNGYQGIRTDFSSYNTISDSSGTSLSNIGILLSYSNYSNITRSSGSTYYFGAGIVLSHAFHNNIISSNGTAILKIPQDKPYPTGIVFSSSSNNTISNSIATSYDNYAIQLYSDSNNNIISNNTLVSILGTRTLLNISSNSHSNTFYWNNFTSTSGYYVQDLDGSNYYNTSVGSVPQGNYYFNISSKNIYDSDDDGWGDSGDDYPLSASTWASKWSGYGTDYGPATDKELVNCSTVLEANTVYTLTENVSINGSTCFNVSVENVTIDCDGFSIRGNNSVNTYGIYSTTYNTTIVNCDINTFQYAVYFNGATNGNIKDSNVSSQHGSGGTIYLRYGSNNNIENVRSIVQVSGPRGIQIINSIGNTISSVTATGTASGSISLYSANYTNIINTNSSSTGYGNAFLIASNSHYNNLINVTWASPLWSGVIFELSDDNSLINSSGTAGLHSIYIYTSSNTTIDSSTGTSNTGNGIYAWYNSHNNRIINSTGTSTSGYGIYVYTSNNNIIVNSSGASSSSNGLRLIASSGNNITSSTLRSGTSTPVFMNGSSNNNIISNTLISNNNLTDLIKLYLSSGNKLFWNNFTQTTGYYVQDSNGSNFYNTSVGGVAQGNYYFNITSKNIYDSNNDGWGDSGDDYPLSSLTWASKWTGYGTDYGPATTREESSGSSGGSNSDYVPSNVIAPSDEIEPEEEETPEPIIESITIEEVEANTPKNFVLQNEEIPVSNIVITTESALKNVELSVTSYDYNPTTPITQSKSKVYKYLQIQKSIEDTQLKNASIIFIVKKNWLKEQGVSENDIILLRLKDKNWSELDTSILNITNDSILYEAITPGFSFFAIAIRFETADSGPSSMVVSNSSELPKTVIVVNPEKIVKKTTVFATPLIIIIAVIVMLASAGALSIGSFKFKKKEINIKPIKGNLSEAQRHQVWDYINKARALNVSDEKLIENLRKGGLSDEHISTFSLDPKLYPKK